MHQPDRTLERQQIQRRITQGLQYLAGNFSAEADDFRRDNRPGGAALLEGLTSQGFAARHPADGSYHVTDMGFRRLRAADGDQVLA